MYEIRLNEYENYDWQVVNIGHQMEDDTRALVYDLSDMIAVLGDGTFEYVMERPDGEVYLAENISRQGSKAYWALSEIDTAVAGDGRIELRFYPTESTGEVQNLCKTKVFKIHIDKSIGITGDVPEPYEEYLEQFRGIRDETVEASESAESSATSASGSADRAETASQHYPYIGANGNWFVWDVETEGFVDTGAKATGDFTDYYDKSEVDTLLGNKLSKNAVLEVTLSADDWTDNEQTISNAYFVASGYVYFVTAKPDSINDYADAFIYADEVTTSGQMTFHCEEAPASDIDVEVMRFEVTV